MSCCQQEMPASSCADLARMSPHFESGVYWLQPLPNQPAFQVIVLHENIGKCVFNLQTFRVIAIWTASVADG